MRYKNFFFAIFFVLIISPLGSYAQKAKRVSIICTCSDATGRAYVDALHLAIAKSSSYREVSTKDGFDTGVIRISIVSLPLDETEGKPRSALSIVCLHEGAVMHQFVETCTHIPIGECAESMINDLKQWDS